MDSPDCGDLGVSDGGIQCQFHGSRVGPLLTVLSRRAARWRRLRLVRFVRFELEVGVAAKIVGQIVLVLRPEGAHFQLQQPTGQLLHDGTFQQNMDSILFIDYSKRSNYEIVFGLPAQVNQYF